ncbi:hypothetical protein T439DRAFT_85282 [Meredithblackwellia eburnea MCA 4105]
MVQLKSLALLALSTLASATYYPPFLTPKAGDIWQGSNGHSYKISWNQTLPHGVSSSQAASSATLVLGFLVGGSPLLNSGGGLFAAGCKNTVTTIKPFSGDNFVEVTASVGATGNFIVAWYQDPSGHSDEFKIVKGSVTAGAC